MKKKEITTLAESMKHQRTKKLESITQMLSGLRDERSLTKRMYFWSDFGNCQQRQRFENRYNEYLEIPITKDMKVVYRRSVSPSRNYAYAKDWLWGETPNGDIDLTLTDVKKILAAIEEILERRAPKAATA